MLAQGSQVEIDSVRTYPRWIPHLSPLESLLLSSLEVIPPQPLHILEDWISSHLFIQSNTDCSSLIGEELLFEIESRDQGRVLIHEELLLSLIALGFPLLFDLKVSHACEVYL